MDSPSRHGVGSQLHETVVPSGLVNWSLHAAKANGMSVVYCRPTNLLWLAGTTQVPRDVALVMLLRPRGIIALSVCSVVDARLDRSETHEDEHPRGCSGPLRACRRLPTWH